MALHHRLEDGILVLVFKNKDEMNAYLDPISNAMEGVIKNRTGHNFPISFVTKGHALQAFISKLEPSSGKVKYVVGFVKGDVHTFNHEMCHARYFVDAAYKQRQLDAWHGFSDAQRLHITKFLTKLGYDACVHIDEFQAYNNTEARNFWGIELPPPPSPAPGSPAAAAAGGGGGKGNGRR